MAGSSGMVVEGLGMGSCTYSLSSVEAWTVTWVNYGYDTFTEISPQSGCGTISQYETWLSQVKSYVESNAGNNAHNYWGGFMLDEETGWGFSASQYETLNAYAYNVMAGTPGVSFLATENRPVQWSLGVWNALIADGWIAPQVYSTYDPPIVNGECSTYGICINMVTWESGTTYSQSGASNVINGAAWYGWGSYWENVYRSPAGT